MKRKEIFCLLAICTALSAIHPIVAQAVEIKEEQTQTEQVTGDGYEIVENYYTEKSAETSW